MSDDGLNGNDTEAWKAWLERAGSLDGNPLHAAASLTPEARAQRARLGSPSHGAMVGRNEPNVPWKSFATYESPSPTWVRDAISEDAGGQLDGIWLRLDRVARYGLNPTSGMSLFEVGVGGVAIYSAKDLCTALDVKSLEGKPVHLDAGFASASVSAWLSDLPKALKPSLTLRTDPIGALTRDAPCGMSLAWATKQMNLHGELVRGTTSPCKLWLDLTTFHLAGAKSSLEIGLAAATLAEYIRHDVWSGDVGVTVSVGSDFFGEIARMRALRIVLRKVLAFFGKDFEQAPIRVHAVGSARTQTTMARNVNMLRSTLQMAAAATGGADIVTVLPHELSSTQWDPSTAHARRVACNTPSILSLESHLSDPSDPARGAFYVEERTDALARQAWIELQRIEAGGGMIRSVFDLTIQRRLRQERIDTQRSLGALGTPSMIGVTHFREPEDAEPRGKPNNGAQVAQVHLATRQGGPLIECDPTPGPTGHERLTTQRDAQHVEGAIRGIDKTTRSLTRPKLLVLTLGEAESVAREAERLCAALDVIGIASLTASINADRPFADEVRSAWRGAIMEGHAPTSACVVGDLDVASWATINVGEISDMIRPIAAWIEDRLVPHPSQTGIALTALGATSNISTLFSISPDEGVQQ